MTLQNRALIDKCAKAIAAHEHEIADLEARRNGIPTSFERTQYQEEWDGLTGLIRLHRESLDDIQRAYDAAVTREMFPDVNKT